MLNQQPIEWTNRDFIRLLAVGLGIHAYLITTNRPLRLTQAKLEAHPAWRSFGIDQGKHPPCGDGWRSRSSGQTAATMASSRPQTGTRVTLPRKMSST